jgi:hypothetical protein
MKDYLPTTKFGKISLCFLAGFILLFIFNMAFFNFAMFTSQNGVEIVSRPVGIIVGSFGIAGFISGIIGFFTGLYAFIKEKDRSPFVYVVLLLGLFALVFVLGEVLLPH